MGIINKVHPTDIGFIKHIYGVISSLDKKEYKDLTFKTFLECRDNLYIYIDKCYEIDQYPNIDAAIVCRRTAMNDIKIENLRYYCQPYKIMYSIECFHVFNNHKDDVLLEIAKELIGVCLKDKNDAFISIKLYSLNKKLPTYITEVLKYYNFYEESYDSDGIYTFIKPPTMDLNININN